MNFSFENINPSAFFSSFEANSENTTLNFNGSALELNLPKKSPTHTLKNLTLNIKEHWNTLNLMKESLTKKEKGILNEESHLNQKNIGIEKEYNKLKEIFEIEKKKISDYLNEVKASYESKCADYQKMIDEKDATIETLQLDLAMIKDNINKKELEFLEEKQNKTNLLEQLSKKSEELKNEMTSVDVSLNQKMNELGKIKENYIELSSSVSKFQNLFKAYQEKSNNYKEEISKMKKKYENIKMENVDLLVEKERKINEIETLNKKNEFIQEYFKELMNTSQIYLEKIENYKLTIDEFFMRFNASINNQNVYKELISKVYEEIKILKIENTELKVKIEEENFKIEKLQKEKEEYQKSEQKSIQIINIKFYDEVKDKFQKVDQLIKYLAQEKIDALNEKNNLIDEINKMKKMYEINMMQNERANQTTISNIANQEMVIKENKIEEKIINNSELGQEKMGLDNKKEKKEVKNVDSFSGLKICGNCGFLVKKKDEFLNCRLCSVFLHQDCPISVNKENVNVMDKTLCFVCQKK